MKLTWKIRPATGCPAKWCTTGIRTQPVLAVRRGAGGADNVNTRLVDVEISRKIVFGIYGQLNSDPLVLKMPEPLHRGVAPCATKIK